MIRVFFERGGYAELAAVFIDDRMYNDCVPALERMAKDMGFDRVTESIEHSIATDKLIKQIEQLWQNKKLKTSFVAKDTL